MKKTHFGTKSFTRCKGVQTHTMPTTRDPKEVTCKSCQDAMKRPMVATPGVKTVRDLDQAV